MSAIRAGPSIAPRGERTRTWSPSAIPAASASARLSSTQTSGAAACSSGARAVLVRVWKCASVRPVVSSSGNSSLGVSGEGW